MAFEPTVGGSKIQAVVLTNTDGTPISAPATVATGQATMANSVPVAIASNQTAVPVAPGLPACSASHITTAATTTVKGSAGTIHTVNINSAGSASTVTVKDGAAVLAVIDSTAVRPSIILDVACATSIVVVTADGGSHADVTVTYI